MTEQLDDAPRGVQGVRCARPVRIAITTVVWLAGLAAGFYALLSIAIRYGCSTSNASLGCTTSGSSIGVLIVLAVIAVVTTTTVLTSNRSTRGVLLLAAVGIVALGLCLLAAKMLLDTV